MTTPYNIKHALDKAGQARLQEVNDPGANGVIRLREKDLVVCNLTGLGARTLEPASGLPVGTSILVNALDEFITIEGADLVEGFPARFTVVYDASGDKAWSRTPVGPASAGSYEFLDTATAQDTLDGLFAILTALSNQGLIDATGITQA